MNDYEFAESISADVGRFYGRAKSQLIVLPEPSLISQRSLAVVICNIIIDHFSAEIDLRADLDYKIAKLKKSNLINFDVADSLSIVRKNGNKGAHPDEYKLSDSEYLEIAKSSIKECLSLLDFTYQLMHGTASVPAYEVTEPVDDFLQTMSYKAMVEGDAESQYLAGKYFLGRAAKYDDDIRKVGHGFFGQEYQSYLDQAQMWFKLAHHQEHRESLYEYGMMLANGRDKSMIGMGQGCIARSARMGYAEAQVELGLYLRYGSNNFDVDLTEALHFFIEAAQIDHPRALAELADMYANGRGTPMDMTKAYECSVRSAEAGYPDGQFNLAKFYMTGTGVESNEALGYEWMSKSAEQGHPKAMFFLANAITNGLTSAFEVEDAKKYLFFCMHVPDLQNEAKIAYAKYLLKFEPGIEGMLFAASMLQECFESEPAGSQFSKESASLGRQTITDIRQSLPTLLNNPKLVEAAMIVSAYYDEQGYPHSNRAERMGMFIDMSKSHRAGKSIAGHMRTLGIAQDHPKQGRNEPCACGSGKKYKQCCGK
ncbi:Sel1 domain-containing protein [Pseudomonas amygdali pv. mori]|uniref:Sel1 domain-containing protein n=1 Tax=Pseudomonas amygdali pv. mori TaxID=34065 RepID=A0A3M5IP18_PSEA0|nr:tetratricopeptide repeat protein [Pseudomonas amygdali]RMT12400.1 Sel1 domain-containing protein [Pseudomonas amygdali pv. mori]